MYNFLFRHQAAKMKQIAKLAAIVTFGSLLSVVSAQTLQSLETVNMQDGAYQLRYHFDRNVPAPKHFVLKDKNLIVLDFQATGVQNNQKIKKINNFLITDIQNVVNRNQVRSTIQTKADVVHNVSTSGKTVVVDISRAASALTSKQNWEDSVSTNVAVAVPNRIKDVSFFRNSQGAGVIDIHLPNVKTPVNVTEEKNRKIQLELKDHVWEASQNRRIEVTDFATPVSAIEVVNINGQAHVNVITQANYEYSAQQVGSKYQLIVKPKVAAVTPAGGAGKRGQYTGELISINFQDIDVRAVLQIIADFTGLNIVVSDTVDSSITIRLQNVPWDQALDVVLQSKNLTKKQSGNVIFIMPFSEYKSNEPELFSEVIQLNNAKAEDVVKVIAESKNARSGTNNNYSPGLSEYGSVSVDPNQNLLIVRDSLEQIDVLRELIKELDKPLRQVTISSQIIIADDNYSRDLGVRWGIAGRSSTSYTNDFGETTSGTTWPGSGSANWSDSNRAGLVPSPAADVINYINPFTNDSVGTYNPTRNRNTAAWGGGTVTLPVGDPTGSMAINILRKNFAAQMELSAMQSQGRGEILASPTITTTDRNQAYIRQGSEVPYQSSTADSVQTDFKEVVLELNVTPHITPDDRIIMDILVKKDEISSQTGSDGEIIVDKREIKTQAIVEDGQTMVIGGIYQHEVREGEEKVPFFGDVPWFGNLFKKTSRGNKKAEMVIFLTPNIVK